MTIAVGFICTDGIVLAADTKESYGEAGHTYVNKLLFGDGIHYKIGIAGAGTAYPLDYISPRILDLYAGRDFSSIEDARDGLAKLMSSIYASDEFAAYPNKEDLTTSFLVALHVAGQSALLLVNSTLVTRLEEAKVIGAGFMQQMAHEFGLLKLSVEQASSASLYLIYETKRRDGYVGGVTHIYKLYSDGRMDLDRTWDQGARESIFESLRQWNYRIVVTVASPSIQLWDYSEIITSLTRNLRAIRGEFRRIELRYQQWRIDHAKIGNLIPEKLSTAPKRAQAMFRELKKKARPSSEQKSKD